MTAVLTTRALNRATLARQLLLDRADMPVLDAVAHLCGLQAQEPQEPYVGLWSRVRAFRPAALEDLLTDLRAWSGLARLPAAVAAVREELVAYRDERGRELLDLPGAPRPDPDTPAPVRFLPAFDNALLGYHDRTRIVDDAHRGLSVAGERVVLVDGRAAATWTVEAGAVTVTPLRRLSRADRTAVAEEGRELAAFLSDGESDRVRVGHGGE